MDRRHLALGAALALSSLLGACDPLIGVDYSDAQLRDPGSPAADTTTATGSGAPGPATQPTTSCAPKTCAAIGMACGVQNDGCGGAIDCGGCDGGTCQGGQCLCEATSCPALNAVCGTQNDGCGNTLDCGSCPNPADACTEGNCGCVPKSCADQGATCGHVPDGCGHELDCGGCADPGAPNCSNGTCTATPCQPTDCAAQGKNCGGVSNGCGTVIDCGGCTAPASCGGGGASGVCGCTPVTCAQLGASCGSYPDGCGGTVQCGGCNAPQTCGGAGNPKACGCTPSVSACPAGQNCGTVGDGCGNNIACGNCAPPNNTCSGNVCSCQFDGTCNSARGCGMGTDNCGQSCNTGITCGGGGGCFLAGTMVRLADGSQKPIESVVVGDLVASFDAATGETRAVPVTRTLVHDQESLADGVVVIGKLHVTPNHPLLVNGKRTFAGNVHVGDQLVTTPDLRALRTQSSVRQASVALPVTRVDLTHPAELHTYDLKVEGGDGFYADDIGILIKQEPEPIP